jgi:glycosyltransferase involved in cell wall biosynthesis
MISKIPKVSVCVTTYNQEKYIAQCLESLVTQNCDFDFEVIVGEDCSTDNTREIVRQYAERYPIIIKPLFHKENVGGEKNYLLVHEQAKGNYICIVDGDDYALPGKLQAQVDFMDKTPDCNICFHRVKVLFPDGTIKDDLIDYEKIKDGFDRRDLLQYMAVATHSSKMYRNQLKYFELPDFTVSDFYMNVEQIQNKKAYFINNEFYGFYRVGVGQSTNAKASIVHMIERTLSFFIKKYPKEKKYINSLFLFLFLADFKNKRDYKLYMYGWLKSFNFLSIFILLKGLKTRKIFRIPR